jgi:glycosyltransferase involved in cell wall biosynthesis
MIGLDLIIPIYKSAKSIDLLVQKLNQFSANGTFKLHVIFVNDASPDNTQTILNEHLKHAQFSYRAIRLAQNYGQHTATAIGLNFSESKLVATIDDDLQHQPEDFLTLYQHMLNTESDLVYGTFEEKKHHLLRNTGTRILQNILKLDGTDYSMVTSFRLMKSSVITVFKSRQIKTHFIDDFFLLASSKTSSYQVNHQKRAFGNSGYSFVTLLKMGVKILFLHSSLPLKVISRMGLLLSLVFFVLGCFYIYQKLVYDVSIGFTSLIVAIFFSTGLILFSLGIIGEYIRRIWISKQELDKVIIAEVC